MAVSKSNRLAVYGGCLVDGSLHMQVQRRRCSLEWRHSPLFVSWHTASWILASPRCNDFPTSPLRAFSYPLHSLLFFPSSFSFSSSSPFSLLSSLHCRRGTKTGDALCARDVNCSETGRREILGGNCVGFCWRMVPSYTRRDPFRKRGEAIFECGGLIEYFFFFLLKF